MRKTLFILVLIGCGLLVSCHEPMPVGEDIVRTNTFIADISFISPSEGDKWKPGETYEIKWKTIGIVKSVKITLLKKQKYHERIISEAADNTESFLWKVPENIVKSVTYQVKIEDSENRRNYYFSDVFQISD